MIAASRQIQSVLPSRLLLVLMVISLLQACATSSPFHLQKSRPLTPAELLADAETGSTDELDARVAVLPRDKATQMFGADIGSRWIHALWVEMDNRSNHPHWLLQPSLDPDYLSPAEVAYRFRGALNDMDYATLLKRLEEHSFRNPIHGHAKRAGFIFVSTDALDREADITIIGRDDVLELPVYLPRPEILTDDMPDIHRRYPATAIKHLSLIQLRAELLTVGCCTTNKAANKSGDPLNLVIIAKPDALHFALTSRGWHPAEKNYAGSIKKTIASFILGQKYTYSPVSPLYTFGRKQDMAMQKARNSIDQRNHLRLWLTPWLVKDANVWVGQISRDIGVRFTTKTPIFVTHKIDPDTDEARNYLIEDLLLSGQVVRFGYIEGLGASSRKHPRFNLTGDPYFTDGLRAVLFLERGKQPARSHLSRRQIRFLNWDHSETSRDARHIDPTAVHR